MGRAANSGALTEPVFYILSRLHQPAHGYAMMRDITEMADGRVDLKAGPLYGTLDTLQKKGWIRTVDEHPPDRRIEYIVTGTGKQFFGKELIRLEGMLQNAEKTKGTGNKDKC